MTTSASIGNAWAHEAGHGPGGFARNVHHATFVLHERNGAIRNQQREGDLIQIVGLYGLRPTP